MDLLLNGTVSSLEELIANKVNQLLLKKKTDISFHPTAEDEGLRSRIQTFSIDFNQRSDNHYLFLCQKDKNNVALLNESVTEFENKLTDFEQRGIDQFYSILFKKLAIEKPILQMKNISDIGGLDVSFLDHKRSLENTLQSTKLKKKKIPIHIPTFTTDIKESLKPYLKKTRQSNSIVHPELILFDEYEPKVVYRKNFHIKNASNTTRQIRILFFNNECIEISIQDSMTPFRNFELAPGLSVKFCVSFSPKDCIAQKQILFIESAESRSRIEIVCERKKTVLDFKELIHIGSTLPGVDLHYFQEINCIQGGTDFIFLGSQQLSGVDINNPQEVASRVKFDDVNEDDNKLENGIFVIKPKKFSISSGGKIDLEVSMNSSQENSGDMMCCRKEFFMVSREMLVTKIIVHGTIEVPNILFCMDSSMTECHSSSFIDFGEVSVGESLEKTIFLKNFNTHSEEIEWIVSEKDIVTIEDGRTYFDFQPLKSTIQIDQMIETKITFTPHSVRDFEYIASLRLQKGRTDFITIILRGKGKAKEDLLVFERLIHGTMTRIVYNEKDNRLIEYKLKTQSLRNEITCDKNVIDFGLLKPFHSASRSFTLRNDATHAVFWFIKYFVNNVTPFNAVQDLYSLDYLDLNCLDRIKDTEYPIFSSSLVISQRSGELLPQMSTKIDLLFLPYEIQKYGGYICVHVVPETKTLHVRLNERQSEKTIKLRGNVQHMNACLSESKLNLGTLYLNIPVRGFLIIKNLTNYYSKFRIFNHKSDLFEMKFDDDDGDLTPREEKKVGFTFTPLGQTDELSKEAQFVCIVEGMKSLLVFELDAVIKKFSCSLSLNRGPQEETDLLQHDFGTLKVGEKGSVVLSIKNLSKISSLFSVIHAVESDLKFESPSNLLVSISPINGVIVSEAKTDIFISVIGFTLGSYEQALLIQIKDYKNVKLKFKASVMGQCIEFFPLRTPGIVLHGKSRAMLPMGTINRLQGKSCKVTLKNIAQREANIVWKCSENEFFKVSQSKLLLDADGLGEFRIEFTGVANDGEYSCRLTGETKIENFTGESLVLDCVVVVFQRNDNLIEGDSLMKIK